MAVHGSNSLFFSTGLQNDGLKSGANEAVNIISNLSSRIAGINPFAALLVGASAAFSGIANEAYKMMKEFEQAMKEVQTISKATQDDFEGISSAVFALSKISPDAPVKLAQAYYQIVSAGYDGARGLELLETATKAATAGVTDTMTAADGITTVLNAFKLEATEAEHIADVMFTTVKNGKTTFEELSRQLSDVAPLAAASGYSFEEVSAAIATLTKQGVPTTKAVTQIRAALEKTTEILGDGAGEAMTLQNAFQAVYDKAGGSQNELRKLIGTVEGVSAVISLAGDNAEGAAKDLADMGSAAGASNDAFERMTTSTVNQWSILGNRISATTEGIGNALVKISNQFAGFLNDAIDDGNRLKQNLDDQRVELLSLETALGKVTQGSDEWKEIRDKIIKNYPEFVSGIDDEKTSTQQLLDVLNQVNDAYIQRYKFESRTEELNKALREQAKIEDTAARNRLEIENFINKLRVEAEDNGVKLNIDFDQSSEEIFKSIEKEFEKLDPSALDEGYFSQGYAMDELKNIQALINIQNAYNKTIEERKQTVDELIERNERLTKQDLKTQSGRLEAIKRINEATKESQIAEFKDSGVKEIEDALKARQKIINQYDQIRGAENIESLKPFLDSEIDEIKKFAKERQRFLNTDYSGTGGGGGFDPKAYEKSLKERRDQYQTYQAVVNQIGKEAADEQFKDLMQLGKNYGQFLQNELEATTSYAKQQAIAVAAEVEGIDLNRPSVSTVSELKPKPVVLDFTIDQSSINYLNRQISELKGKFNSATTSEDREQIAAELMKWEERLATARRGVEQEKSIYDTIPLHLNDLNRKELNAYLKYWKDKIKIAKKNSNEVAAKEAETKVAAATKEIGSRTSDTIREVSDSLGQASDMFRKFGDEDLANALGMLADVGNSVSSIVSGVTSGNWLQVVGGVTGVLSTLFAGNQQNGYQKSIENLEGSISRLGYQIERSFGSDAIKLQKEQVERYLEKVKEANEEIKRLEGVIDRQYRDVAPEDRDSFFRANIEGMEQSISELEDELNKMETEYAQALADYWKNITGSTRDELTDAILQGFRDGKRGIEDFAETFEDTMRDAILNTFKNQFLEREMQGFYEKFAEFSESGGGLDANEMRLLRKLYNDIVIEGGQRMDDWEAVLGEGGVNPFGGESAGNQQGMRGAIKGITEDQAGVLEGYMNAVRLDVRQGLEVATQSSIYLSEIAVNTRYNRHLESISISMKTIENGILEFQSRS